MRTQLTMLLAACCVAGVAAPAQAALIGASGIDLSNQDYTFGFGGSDFTFSYRPSGSFDLNPVSIQTSGTGAVTAFGGFLGIPLQPSTFFTRFNVTIGPDTIPGFASFTDPTAIPYSISDGDLGLRVAIGADTFYGYARFGGSIIQSIAFENTPNTAITAGSFAAAVPEPATWAMLIGGVGLVGGTMRRRRGAKVSVAYA